MVYRIVHQHHPQDIQYSLEDVATEASTFIDDLTDDSEDCKVIGYRFPTEKHGSCIPVEHPVLPKISLHHLLRMKWRIRCRRWIRRAE